MRYTQTWITPWETELSSAELEPVHNTFAPPYSIAFFCPNRGDIWARRICTDEQGRMTRFMCYTIPHPDEPHPYREYWPAGRLLDFIDERAWPLLPSAILAREFLLYYDWAKGLDSLQTMGDD